MKKGLVMLLAIVCLGAVTDARASTIFNFQFDNQGLVGGDGPIVPPVVGSGTFVSPTDLAPGTYDLTDPSLVGFALNLDVNGDTYDQTDITTPLTGVAIRIASVGTGERLFFTESGGTGSDGGTSAGALDLSSGGASLTFEPTYFGGNYLYQETSATGARLAGRYDALSPVPEPASLTLTGLGLAGALGRLRRRLAR